MSEKSLVRLTRPQLRAFAQLSPVAARLAAAEIRRRATNRMARYELDAIRAESWAYVSRPLIRG